MLDIFIFETVKQIEQLEQLIINNEKSNCYTQNAINEIFRIMHTIKGSAAMMCFDSISLLSHTIEDLFYFLREEKPQCIDCSSLSDLVLEGIDFIKVEVDKIRNGYTSDGDALALTKKIKEFLSSLKYYKESSIPLEEDKPIQVVKRQNCTNQDETNITTGKNVFMALLHFEEGCEMENIRAYSVIHNLESVAKEIHYIPEDLMDIEKSVDVIREEGFKVYIRTDFSYEEINEFLLQTVFLKELVLTKLDDTEANNKFSQEKLIVLEDNDIELSKLQKAEAATSAGHQQSLISVNVNKLDKLMDLVGEMVIAEAMVTQNPDLNGLELHNFHKSARQLKKITSELQDMVMEVRMLPISATFHKMHRIVRDMCKKLNKEVQLELIGEETEVDKNIIEHISDPLMHLIRNSIDHGIEASGERIGKGKPQFGTITLKAQNSGSDVVIMIKDDGKGLDREKILKRAKEHGLLYKPENEMSDREIFSLILLPGFSTKDDISEFSGRGVGMDVVVKNIETVGGSVSVDSAAESGTTITLKIPLTLAIIDGMNIRVGKAIYTIPTISIMESFKPKESDIITDPDGNEMIMVRGQCHPILRLHEYFKIETNITNISEGIIVMVENGDKSICTFADELVGEQQVVVKTLPAYIRNIRKIHGVAGCTLLGDGSISLILDTAGLYDR
jgi:two-component system chemotaxis sensor kinase CheA